MPSREPRSGLAFRAADLDEIIDHSPIAMCLATSEDGILRANHAAAELTGRTLGDLRGKRLLHTFVHPDEVAMVSWVGDRIRAGEAVEVRHRLLTLSGAARHVRGSITPILHEDRSLRYGLAQYVDETELVVASRQLEEQRRLLAGFAEVVAHDLRSPVAGMVGFAHILEGRRAELDPAVAEIVELLSSSAREASDLIERTLDRALRAGSVSPVVADLIDIVDRVANLLAPNLAACGGRIAFTGGVRFLMGDPAVVQEILVNLCQNAVKYRSEAPPEIEIHVDPDAEDLIVADNGRGIAPELAETIFERGVTVHPDDDGRGTGLARVRSLIESMDGRIRASTGPAGGTVMRVHLPGGFVREGE
jgi:PAS domain S-box-containing protein